MADKRYDYVIVGAGLAGGSAIAGIRERDADGSILLIGDEEYLPYNRPPLTKKLWFGKEKVEEIFVHDRAFYEEKRVDTALGCEITNLDPANHTTTDDQGNRYTYGKLLLATGGAPRRLEIPGGDLAGVCYYRYLNDYLRIHGEATKGSTAVVIGGGFIGSEIAAGLTRAGVAVTMVFREGRIVSRVFPEGLGTAVQQHFQRQGIVIHDGDAPVALERHGTRYVTHTRNGSSLESDMLIVGVGIHPLTGLAERAGLAVDNGITVNEYLESSDPDIYAAGDNANFPYLALGERRRVEHWDNALNQGQYAGRNMAGANQAYDYMPYFFSDLFEFGYEAVGDVTTKLETYADWIKENDTGVIYYQREGKVRGVMLCNVWNKLDAARDLIRAGQTMSPEALRGHIRPERKAA